jgi:hypothetical protein
VVDEVALTVVTVAHEGSSRRLIRIDLHRADVDAVVPQPLDRQQPEVIVTDAADDPAELIQLRYLVDEDRGRAARKRTDQHHRLAEAVTDGFRHYLNENLAQSDDLLQLPLSFVFAFAAALHRAREVRLLLPIARVIDRRRSPNLFPPPCGLWTRPALRLSAARNRAANSGVKVD